MASLYHLVVLSFLVFVLDMPRPAYSVCNPYYGPSGGVDCITILRYFKPQWGICLTNQYIKQKSKGLHQCEDQTATYCYYQCMIESYGINSGAVTDECACSLDSPQRTTSSPMITLDPACYSPNGADCNWYRNCLEKKFHCSETADDYGITYGEKFCNRYLERYQTFSRQGQRWVDAVRKCLQVELVPLLRPYASVTCADIRERAFRSHAGCYVQPYQGAVSVCSLSCFDFMQIFWTIKSAFSDAFQESMYGIFQVAKSCALRSPCLYEMVGGGLETYKLVVRLAIPLIRSTLRLKRDAEFQVLPVLQAATSTENLNRFDETQIGDQTATDILQRPKRQIPTETWTGETTLELAYHKAASQAAQSMASQLGWGSSGVMWFAYGQQFDNTSMDVHILLADKYTYGLNETVKGTPQPNMTLVVQKAADAIHENHVNFQINGESVRAVALDACVDLKCQQVYLNVTAKVSSNTAESPVARFTTDLLVVMVVWWVAEI